MNKTLETIRGSWITRDRETAEANRAVLHYSIDQIPVELREKYLCIVDWADRIELWNDIIVDGSAKDSDRRLNEIIFLEAQIKILVQAIRLTKDVESIRQLRLTTRETIERMEQRKREEDLKRLQQGAAFIPPGSPSSVVVP